MESVTIIAVAACLLFLCLIIGLGAIGFLALRLLRRPHGQPGDRITTASGELSPWEEEAKAAINRFRFLQDEHVKRLNDFDSRLKKLENSQGIKAPPITPSPFGLGDGPFGA